MNLRSRNKVRGFKNGPVKNCIQQMDRVLRMGDVVNPVFHGIIEPHDFPHLITVDFGLLGDGLQEKGKILVLRYLHLTPLFINVEY